MHAVPFRVINFFMLLKMRSYLPDIAGIVSQTEAWQQQPCQARLRANLPRKWLWFYQLSGTRKERGSGVGSVSGLAWEEWITCLQRAGMLVRLGVRGWRGGVQHLSRAIMHD